MTDERADKGFFDKLRERVRADRPPSPTEVRKRFASSEISELHRRFEDTRPDRGEVTNWNDLRTSEGEKQNDKN
ncbi:hypothetical protein BH20ACI2_BH20ACI2_09790 [soil metagenome]